MEWAKERTNERANVEIISRRWKLQTNERRSVCKNKLARLLELQTNERTNERNKIVRRLELQTNAQANKQEEERINNYS